MSMWRACLGVMGDGLGKRLLPVVMLAATVLGMSSSAVHAATGEAPQLVAPPSVILESMSLEAGSDVVSSQVGPDIFSGIYLNDFLGATRFYDNGYTGGNATIANVEAGHAWSGHQSLSGAISKFIQETANPGPQTGETDRHATWTMMLIGGRPVVVNDQVSQGIAPGATLYSASLATSWSGTRYSTGFGVSVDTLVTGYATAFEGDQTDGPADVVSSSWGYTDPNATNAITMLTDAYAYANPRTTFVASAGNAGPNANTVGGPGAGLNVITVGSVGADTDLEPYNQVSSFSSRSPSDLLNLTGVRAAVDIVAPGQNLTSAYYGGQTGGNSPLLAGPASGPAGTAATYSGNIVGTSFATPLVAGGAGLLVDVAYDQFPFIPDARDARVIKAVLLNSADKTRDWDNGQFVSGDTTYTFQSLDLASGAGRMNLDQAFDQYTSGTTNVSGLGGGNVQAIGWDFGQVFDGSPNEYYLTPLLRASQRFTATLTWFMDRSFDGELLYNNSYNDLDLELWELIAGTPTNLIAASYSAFNNVEHFMVNLPRDGYYMLNVVWAANHFGDTDQERYGLAWATIPEPGGAALMILGVVALVGRRRR